MNDTETPNESLRRLANSKPISPFHGLKRRPNGYLKHPGYIRYTDDFIEWDRAMRQLVETHAAIGSGPDWAAMTFAGEPVADTMFQLQPDGAVVIANSPDPDAYDNRILHLPRPKQGTKRFLETDRRDEKAWRLEPRLGRHIERLGGANTAAVREPFAGVVKELEPEWLNQIRRLLDEAVFRAVWKLSGRDLPVRLPQYNAVAARGELITDLSRSNPGAVAWYLYALTKETSGFQTPAPQYPDSPGQIIAAVKERFRAAGGQCWKRLATQPGPAVAAQLTRQGGRGAAYIADILGATQTPWLPQAEPPPPRRRRPTGQLAFDLSSARPSPGDPARYPEPPLNVKLALLASRDIRDGDETPPEVRHIHRIIAAHYAGQDQEQSLNHYFQVATDLKDYALAQPEQALRHRSWRSLNDASRDWHRKTARQAEIRRRRNIERARQLLAGADACIDFDDGRPWPCELPEAAGDGWVAHALASADDLDEESAMLKHCVGGGGYARGCRRGDHRLYHLRSSLIDPKDWSQQRSYSTTVQLAPVGNSWAVVQQRGYCNRKATDTESHWARQLLRQWLKAYQQTEAAVTP